MKKVLIMFAMIFATLTFAQEKSSNSVNRGQLATQAGTYVVGVNSSGIGFSNVGNRTDINVGATFGAFVAQRFALVTGVGYQSYRVGTDDSNNWSYGAGVKYYLGGFLPLQVDWNGSTGNDNKPSRSNIGFQLGYAWFPFSNFSIEPSVRYNRALKKEYFDEDVFSGGLGFNLFF